MGTNKTQVLHRLRLQLFTPLQRKPDVQNTSQEWQPDPEVIMQKDVLDGRAWESEYQTPIFGNDQDEPDNHNSPKITVRIDPATDESCTIPGTAREGSPEVFPKRQIL